MACKNVILAILKGLPKKNFGGFSLIHDEPGKIGWLNESQN